MSFFQSIQPKGSKPISPKSSSVRKETVSATLAPKRAPHLSPFPAKSRAASIPAASKRLEIREQPRSVSARASRRQQSAQPRLESDSDDLESDTSLGPLRKRVKVSEKYELDLNRKLRCKSAFSERGGDRFSMVHAADIASLGKTPKYKVAFPDVLEAHTVLVQYPSAGQPERYDLVEPVLSDDFKPLEDVRETMEVIISNYLPLDVAETLNNDSHGLLRRIKRAQDKRAGTVYIQLVQEWNDTITKLHREGSISSVLDEIKRLDLRVIERILTQTYARTVSPRVSLLRQYENGSDNVYGELLPKFVSEILKDTKLKSDHIFVDLGSGVGNVVLQAALEVGCESWGCEMMENACVLADLQEKEFKARCCIWGLSIGDIHLQRGDFLENVAINQVLPKADMVLINNQAFTPELNDRLTSHFLDLKEGCQIVSLKSFVPYGHKITSRNLNSAYNVLDVMEKRYYSACVSWTDAPGSYFVSRKDSSRLREFIKKNQGA